MRGMKLFSLLLLLLLCVCEAAPVWNPELFGLWSGIPTHAVTGPFNRPFQLQIQSTGPTSFVMNDSFIDVGILDGSSQHFYVEDDSLLYCGILDNFFSTNVSAPIAWDFTYQSASSNDTHYMWCDKYWGCSTVQWDIWLRDTHTLEVQVLLSAPVVHLHVVLKRIADLPPLLNYAPQLKCNFSAATRLPPGHPHPSREGRAAGGCPFAHARGSVPAPHIPRGGEYDFCYVLNDAMQYRLQWTFDRNAKMLHVSISAATGAGDWIALGFQPSFPGMNGSDIVLGYVAGGQQCVRTMYAVHYVGTPQDSSDLQLQDQHAAFANGILTVKFSRKFDTGHHPIPIDPQPFPTEQPFVIMFATGAGPLTSCTSTPAYHGTTRGTYAINWQDPDSVIDPERKCPKPPAM